jgi:hypothetical protein
MWWVDGCSRESKLDFPASRRICFAMSHQPETVVTGLAEWARQSKPEAGMRRSPGEPAAALEVGLGTMAHHWRAKIPPPSPVHGWKNSRGPQFAGELEEHFVRIRILTFPDPPGAFVRLGEPGARLRAASSATEKVRGRRRRPSSGAVAKPSPWRRWTCLMASLPGTRPAADCRWPLPLICSRSGSRPSLSSAVRDSLAAKVRVNVPSTVMCGGRSVSRIPHGL